MAEQIYMLLFRHHSLSTSKGQKSLTCLDAAKNNLLMTSSSLRFEVFPAGETPVWDEKAGKKVLIC